MRRAVVAAPIRSCQDAPMILLLLTYRRVRSTVTMAPEGFWSGVSAHVFGSSVVPRSFNFCRQTTSLVTCSRSDRLTVLLRQTDLRQ